MTANRTLLPFLLALAANAGAAGAQTPAATEAKGTWFEATLATKKVSLLIPEGWAECDAAALPAAMPDSVGWKAARAWRSGELEELTLRLGSVEKAGFTAAKVRDLWFEHARAAGAPGMVVKADVADPKNKALTGHEIEADFKVGDEKVYAWLRVINLAKDKVAVLLAEARPLKQPENAALRMECFVREPHVLAVVPILGSFLKKNAKPEEAWVRSAFEFSHGPARVRFDAPKGWKYTRLGPEGSVIWMAPDDSDREYIIGMSTLPGVSVEAKIQVERMLVETTGGKVHLDRKLDGTLGGHEIISASKIGDRTLWNWRRAYQQGDTMVSILAKVPIADVSETPSDKVQKEAKAFLDAARVGP